MGESKNPIHKRRVRHRTRRRAVTKAFAAATPIDNKIENFIESEAARFLRLSSQTLSNWRSMGVGPAYSKIGGRVLYTREALVAFVKANERSATTHTSPAA